MNTTAIDIADRVADASGSSVAWERHGAVGHVILNRPDKLNAINRGVLAGLVEAVAQATVDLTIKVLLIRGAGRAFSAGGDLEEVAGLVQDSAAFDRFLDEWHTALLVVANAPLPVVAAVHGIAFAGGVELMQVAVVVVIGDGTRIGDQHATFGLFPAGGSTQRLPRLVGSRLALWMLMSGEAIDPSQALTAGLATAVVAEDDVLAKATEMAEALAKNSRNASAAIKAAVTAGDGLPVESAIRAERQIAVGHMASDDVQTGLAAFRARTTPTFD